MNLLQRCDNRIFKGPHLKPKQEFRDRRGRFHPTCNECRWRIQNQREERLRLERAEQDLVDLFNDPEAMDDLTRGISCHCLILNMLTSF